MANLSGSNGVSCSAYSRVPHCARVAGKLQEAADRCWLPDQVPGEMFALAMEAKKRDMGVVGSTQNILDFIAAKLSEAVERPFPDTLQVWLKLYGLVLHDSPECRICKGMISFFLQYSKSQNPCPSNHI